MSKVQTGSTPLTPQERPTPTFDWSELKRRDVENVKKFQKEAKIPERGFTVEMFMKENGVTRREAYTMIQRMRRNGTIQAIGKIYALREDGLGGIMITVYDMIDPKE